LFTEIHKLSPTITPRQRQFLQRLEDAHQRILACIDGLDEPTLCNQVVAGEWTVKDILGHLVSWDEEFRLEIKEILAGQHPGLLRRISGEDDFATWNRQNYEVKRDWSWERILADFERDIAEAADLILSLTPADYRQRGLPAWKKPPPTDPKLLLPENTASVASIITWHWRHINEHAREIERWRGKRA
jgi:hypothetical protein